MATVSVWNAVVFH